MKKTKWDLLFMQIKLQFYKHYFLKIFFRILILLKNKKEIQKMIDINTRVNKINIFYYEIIKCNLLKKIIPNL